MRVRRYKVTVTNSDGVLDTAFFITKGAAYRYVNAWRERLLYLYSERGLLDPYAYFVIKKWLPKHKAWDFVFVEGSPRYVEDLYRRVK